MLPHVDGSFVETTMRGLKLGLRCEHLFEGSFVETSASRSLSATRGLKRDENRPVGSFVVSTMRGLKHNLTGAGVDTIRGSSVNETRGLKRTFSVDG